MLLLASPIAGNFDGAGGDTIGIYDQKNGHFAIYSDNSPTSKPALEFAFDAGPNVTISALNPVGIAGHWTGGSDGVGIYDGPSATFQLRGSLTAGAADTIFTFGPPNAMPIAGDWDGDGVDTIGVYDRTSGQFLLRNANSAGPADVTFAFGPIDAANMWPVAGDWDGDGIDTIAVFDSASYILYIRNSNTAGPPDQTIQLERTTWGWQPIAGKWRPTTAPPESPGYAWPTADPATLNIDAGKLDAAFAFAKSLPFTQSLLVIRHGTLAREAYFNGNRPEIAHDLASAAKSVISALIGIAEGEGKIGPLTTALPQFLPAKYFPDPTDPRASITLAGLMTMSSGLISVHQMTADNWAQVETISHDWTQSILAMPLTQQSGEWGYGTMGVVLGARILQDRVGMPLDEYAKQKLCDPLGIRIPWWEHDPQGYLVGGGELALKPRDMARFGYLFLQRGNVDGQQIIPAPWVDLSTGALVSVTDPADQRFGKGYGLWWWHPVQGTGPGSDVYAALGYGGQYIYVIPSQDAIIVITAKDDATGDDLTNQFDQLDTLLAYTFASIQ